jgi:hypothetical protein
MIAVSAANEDRLFSRRRVLQSGAGLAALASLLGRDGLTAESGRTDRPRPHFPPRAKNVIYMHMVGAPSQLDLFDPKPVLKEFHGKPCPEKYLTEGQQFAFIRGRPKLMGSGYKFERRGECGMWMSELLPELSGCVDEMTMIHSLHTEQINHGPAQMMMSTGFGRLGRPSMGAWVSYGLGSENEDLPAFVVLNSGDRIAGGGSALWGPGFLPSKHQGVEFRSGGDAVLYLSNPDGVRRDDRRRELDVLRDLNQLEFADAGDPEIETRIQQYELAFRMQTSVPELMDIKGETKATLAAYGAIPGKASFAGNCLLARRLVERGVRFVQLYDSDWDHHGNLASRLPKKCREIDRPCAALLHDLKERGLLEETLVVWGSEFGRTPVMQGNDGRDHHIGAFSAWLAGGGVKAGFDYGASDDIGFEIAEQPMHVNDFHATLLHLLGIDHEQLTFRRQGRDFRLTDVGGKVAKDILA